MIRIRTLGVGVAMLAGAFFIGTAFRSPISQAHGAYSSPVTVFNTTSNPAIGSIMDDPGRIPYISKQGSFVSAATASVVFDFPAVPANHRLVVTQMSGNLALNTNSTTINVALGNPANLNEGQALFFAPIANFQSQFTGPVTFYFDAGQAPRVQAVSNGAAAFAGGEAITLFGYMLDCSAAPCAPLAQ